MKKLLTTGLLLGILISGVKAQSKEEFKPTGKLWGYAFYDYAYKVHADSAGRGNQQYSGLPKGNQSFEFRRIYLGYDYNITERFSTEFLVAYEGSDFTSNAQRTVYIKSANLRYKNIYKNADIVVGQMQTLAYPMMSEKVWGYRSVEKTITDARKIVGSNDLGIALQGKFDNKGNYGYNVMIGNGSGAKLESDKYKRMYFDVYAKFMNQKLIVDLYTDYNPNVYYLGTTTFSSGVDKSATVYKAFVAYQTDPITVGIEGFIQNINNGTVYKPTGAAKNDTTGTAVTGISIFARGTIIKDKLAGFIRYDIFNPDKNFKSDVAKYPNSVSENFITAGLDFTPVKNVHIIPNIWYNAYNNRTNGVSGLNKSDYDLEARLTLHYIYK